MSSILKALKKLEQEKMAGTPGPLEIDGEILRNSEDNPHSRFSLLKGIIPAAFIFICGGAVTYVFLSTTDQAIIKKQAPYVAEIERFVEAEVPAVSAPQAETGRDNGKGYFDAVPQLKNEIPSSAHGKPKKNKALPAVPVKSPTTDPNQEQSQKQQLSLVETIPLLHVNGIAFQPEGNDSEAIVNGNNVSSGSSVNGATVEEILKDRVRFNYKGENIEVLLGRSNQ